MYSVVDLFAGAGGLSLGFQQTGQFKIVAAAENNSHAKKTYCHNHPGVEMLDDVRTIDYSKLEQKYGSIDVVIGGPPCQGFSNANRQKAQAISSNNSLVKEYVRAVRELQPMAFVMENVGMLKSTTHRFYYSKQDQELIDSLDLEMREDKLVLLPAVYCGGKARQLSESLDRCAEYLWPDKDYETLNILYHQRRNPAKFKHSMEKYQHRILTCAERLSERCSVGKTFLFWEEEYYLATLLKLYINRIHEDNLDNSTLLFFLEGAILLQRMLRHYQELLDNNIIIEEIKTDDGIYAKVHSYPVFEYIRRILQSEPYHYQISAKVLNSADYGAPQKRERYIILGIKNGEKPGLPTPIFTAENYRTVYDAIADLESIKPTTEISDPPMEHFSEPISGVSPLGSLRNTSTLFNHVVTATRATALARYQVLKPGENFHNLADDLKSTYTDAKRTQNTIYLRLKYNEPSGTVLNVRKSMWIHPVLDRAISVREAARLQTFPDSFVFLGTKDSQYQQVGNAVPPMLANAIAEHLLLIIRKMDYGG